MSDDIFPFLFVPLLAYRCGMDWLVGGTIGLLTGLTLAFVLLRLRPKQAGDDLQTALVRNDLTQLRESLRDLADLVNRNAGDGKAGFAQLSTVLRTVDERTNTLTSALSNSRVRGQWGERAAEDILRAAGLVEGVSYFKQRAASNGSRPDFTFPLPNGSVINMDVKFPIENYARLVEASNETDAERLEKAFLRDVRDKVREVGSRSYADPGNGTVDYALLFIPSESVYAEINRLDPALVDFALTQRVVPCSPLTLFGVLAVVRKAVDSFAFQQASDEVLRLMERFEGEWLKFNESLTILGKQLVTAKGTYDNLTGVRLRALEIPLRHIAAVRQERGLPPVRPLPADEDDQP